MQSGSEYPASHLLSAAAMEALDSGNTRAYTRLSGDANKAKERELEEAKRRERER